MAIYLPALWGCTLSNLRAAVVIDTETGGLNAEKDSILTFCAINLVGKKPMDLRIKQNGEVSADALGINHIDLAAHNASAIDVVAAARRIVQKRAILDPHVIWVGHNPEFDMRFTERLLEQAKAYDAIDRLHQKQYIDTHEVFRSMVTDGPGDLWSACSALGVPMPDAAVPHTAYGDCLACFCLYYFMRQKLLLEGKNIASFAHLYRDRLHGYDC